MTCSVTVHIYPEPLGAFFLDQLVLLWWTYSLCDAVQYTTALQKLAVKKIKLNFSNIDKFRTISCAQLSP